MKTSRYSASNQNASKLIRPPEYLLPREWFTERQLPGLMANTPLFLLFGHKGTAFIQDLHYWLKHSKNVYDGRLWSYNTLETWCKYLAVSEGTMKRLIDQLENIGVLLVRRKSRRQPNWYSIDYEKLRHVIMSDLKERGYWPKNESDHNDPSQAPESDHNSLTQAPSQIKTISLQEPNSSQQTSFKQEPKVVQQQTNPDVVVKIMISDREANTDRLDKLLINPSQQKDTGYKLQETGEDKNSAELAAIFQQFLAEFGSDIPDDIKGEMQAAGVQVCRGALNATLERKKVGKLTSPAGFLRRAVAKQWIPLKKPPLNRELRKLLDELDWSTKLTDKDWPNRPEEALVADDLNETDQQAYIEFLHQCLHNRNQQAAGLMDEIRSEWRRIGYDSGPNEIIEQGWWVPRFTTLANVPRNPNYAEAYLANLRKRPDKGDIESDQKSHSSDFSASRITKTESSPRSSMSSIGDLLQKERFFS